MIVRTISRVDNLAAQLRNLEQSVERTRLIVLHHNYKSVAESARQDDRDGAMVPFERVRRFQDL